MSEKKLSKRGFIKLALSAMAFMSLGGLSFLLPKNTNKSTLGYGKGGYGE